MDSPRRRINPVFNQGSNPSSTGAESLTLAPARATNGDGLPFRLRGLLHRPFDFFADPRDAPRQAGGDALRAAYA